MFKELYNKRVIHFYILIWVLIILICIAGFFMVKYFVKGETKMPFIISKILIVSSAQTTDINLVEKNYFADVIQKNDIYIAIEKNQKYNKEEIIDKISFENFKIFESENIGELGVYRPSKEEKLFTYKEEDKQEAITYVGAQETNIKTEKLEIANQGGIINFSIALNELGEILFSEEEDINIDGRLLNKLQIPKEKIEYKVSFDVKIMLETGNVFYTNIILELPVGNILEEGIAVKEYEDVEGLIFKRGKM